MAPVATGTASPTSGTIGSVWEAIGAPVPRDQLLALASGPSPSGNGHIVPIPHRSGERLLENLSNLQAEQVGAIEAPRVPHIKYRVVR